MSGDSGDTLLLPHYLTKYPISQTLHAVVLSSKEVLAILLLTCTPLLTTEDPEAQDISFLYKFPAYPSFLVDTQIGHTILGKATSS